MIEMPCGLKIPPFMGIETPFYICQLCDNSNCKKRLHNYIPKFFNKKEDIMLTNEAIQELKDWLKEEEK
jgi:hypothetical protein